MMFSDRLPFYPWNCKTENLGVRTDGHRDDDREDTLCLLIYCGDYEDGGLILWELGIVLVLGPGWIPLFYSRRLTHTNENFRGKRGSVVCHVDGSKGKHWPESSNGWEWALSNGSVG
jgi:hypothetical protein